MKHQSGAAAIAAGGFGCVFKPSLLCEGETTRPVGKVSKLMLKQKAEEELDESSRYERIISSLPNHEDYFIIGGITMCKPAPLDKRDLSGFNKICNNLTRKGYMADNVNSKINNLRALRLTDGGIDLREYLKTPLTVDRFNKMNIGLIKLLKHGIVPMNKKKLYHFDLKGANILISNDDKVRIIDWGLSAIQTGTEIPQTIDNRVFQFNVPFGTCLLSNNFKRFLKKELTSLTYAAGSDEIKTREHISLIAVNWIYEFIKNGGERHFNYLTSVVDDIYGDKLTFLKDFTKDEEEKFIKYNILTNIISETVTSIILKYTNFSTMEFDANAYFNEVYCHNVDIFGMLISYSTIFINNSKSDDFVQFPKDEKNSFFFRLRHIFNKYLFGDEYACKQINVDELIHDLKSLSKSLGHNIVTTPPRVVKKKIVEKLKLVDASSSTPKSLTVNKCKTAKIEKCKLKGKTCNPVTGRCNKTLKPNPLNAAAMRTIGVAHVPEQVVQIRRENTRSNHVSRSETELKGKRCKRGYHLIRGTRRCKKIKK